MADAGGTRPFSGFEWMLAGRYLRTRRREGFVSVIAGFSFIGIMLGVATLIIVLSVMNGFRNELLSKIVGMNGHVFIAPIDMPLTDYVDVANAVEGLPGVIRAVPTVEGQAFASSTVQGGGVLVRGVRPDDLRRLDQISRNVNQGSLDTFGEEEGVAIGARLASSLGLFPGDTLTLISPRGAATPFGTAPRIKAYPILAIYEVGMTEFDAAFVYMPLEEAQAYFNRAGDVSVVEVFLDDPEDVLEARTAIEDVVQRPMFLTDWTQRNSSFFSALQVERNVMFIILTLIVLVAALNIVSGLIMLVKDKSADIAILRTMGATRGSVMRVFLITGASIGIVGTIAGLALGVVFTLNIQAIQNIVATITNQTLWDPTVRFLSEIPAEIDWAEVGAVLGMAMGLSLLATLYPSWRAARLDPVEALRYG
ncbi:lipoprotein-releasing ABC transporter permease subunit [Salinarimonas ramus]|uniref:ABC transporter permease n=1 Tax=Salinarimonas ramus TaxID=690164 RepID=A0A917Q5P7_9HYPH|nr:lipoprotein-releasing ABC transporter permease subunit [Salinarimonas ramus]GGK27059.1 ABC transporter permease [Salinarimonas ramus]